MRGADADGNQRPLEPDELTVSSSSSRIAALLPGSQLLLNEPESFTLTATAGGMEVETSRQPRPNRVSTLSLGCDVESARTGDVVQFDASAFDVDGEALAVPIQRMESCIICCGFRIQVPLPLDAESAREAALVLTQCCEFLTYCK